MINVEHVKLLFITLSTNDLELQSTALLNVTMPSNDPAYTSFLEMKTELMKKVRSAEPTDGVIDGIELEQELVSLMVVMLKFCLTKIRLDRIN